jgi:hypothetical protein
MPSIARPKNEEIVCYIRRREARQQNLSTIIKNPVMISVKSFKITKVF